MYECFAEFFFCDESKKRCLELLMGSRGDTALEKQSQPGNNLSQATINVLQQGLFWLALIGK